MAKMINSGTVLPLTITWLNQVGENASVTGTPTITIKRYNDATNDWTEIVTSQSMSLESGSTYFYEFDTTSQQVGKTYSVEYSAIVDALNVKSTEEFTIVTGALTEAVYESGKTEILDQLKELRRGNERTIFNYTGTQLDSIEIQTKADSDADWTTPTSTKTLYFTYDVDGVLTKVGEA